MPYESGRTHTAERRTMKRFPADIVAAIRDGRTELVPL